MTAGGVRWGVEDSRPLVPLLRRSPAFVLLAALAFAAAPVAQATCALSGDHGRTSHAPADEVPDAPAHETPMPAGHDAPEAPPCHDAPAPAPEAPASSSDCASACCAAEAPVSGESAVVVPVASVAAAVAPAVQPGVEAAEAAPLPPPSPPDPPGPRYLETQRIRI